MTMSTILGFLNDICLLMVILLAVTILLAGFNEMINLGWLICAVLIWFSIITESYIYTIPAGIFAIAGAISGCNRWTSGNNKNNTEDDLE